MLLGLILSATGIVLVAWTMVRLATVALPVGLGAAMFLLAAENGPGPLLGLPFGLAVGVAAFVAGRVALASRLSISLPTAIALLFAVPAGIAGHNILSGLMRLGGAGSTSTAAVAIMGAIVIAGAAVISLLPAMTGPVGTHRSPLQG